MRFSAGARQVVVDADAEARMLGHAYIGSEHLLLALLRTERVAETLGLTLDEARERTAHAVGRGGEVPVGHLGFTPNAKRVLEKSLVEAEARGGHRIRRRDVLASLTREPNMAGDILAGES